MASTRQVSPLSSQQFHRQREHFKKRIAASGEEDDPLLVYDQFVQWTLENYPDNDRESGLLELLEETTRKFKDDTSYKTDLRYLKIWSLYAQRVERPATIYTFLIANEIGTIYAMLYEEYANVLEKDGR
jgi:checkpoint serine/threonine-protein kinase